MRQFENCNIGGNGGRGGDGGNGGDGGRGGVINVSVADVDTDLLMLLKQKVPHVDGA